MYVQHSSVRRLTSSKSGEAELGLRFRKNRQTDRQTDRQKDKQTNRQTDRQTDRQKEREIRYKVTFEISQILRPNAYTPNFKPSTRMIQQT